MNLADLIPLADLHFWQATKDSARSLARATRLVAKFNPDLEAPWSPLAAREALLQFPAGSRNRYRAALSTLLKTYRLQGGPRLELPPRFPEAKPRDRVLTEEELDRLIGSDVGLIALILSRTALRISELYRAEIVDGSLYLEDTKNGSRRTVPLDARLRALLPQGGMLRAALDLPSERVLRRLWADAAREVGLEGVTFHVLRHTAITRWAAAGLPVAAIMALAGHKDVATSLRYTHLSTADLEAALLAVD